MLKKLSPVLVLVALCWIILWANFLLLGGHLNQYGIIPRTVHGLIGILFAPLLHGSAKHVAANSIPLLILGGIVCLRKPSEFVTVAFCGIVLGGGLTWIFARQASHIGASGLVFCLFGYLASQAYFRRTFGALVLSAVCLLGYGGLLWGLLPTSGTISWEAHAAGFVSGLFLAWAQARLSPPTKAARPSISEETKQAIDSLR